MVILVQRVVLSQLYCSHSIAAPGVKCLLPKAFLAFILNAKVVLDLAALLIHYKQSLTDVFILTVSTKESCWQMQGKMQMISG